MLNKTFQSIQDGSFVDKLRREILKYVVKNSNTRNRILEDIALQEMKKAYRKDLDRAVMEAKKLPDMEYSNKVWVFWRQGYENASSIIKICIQSVKEQLKDREVVLLSADNLNQYITLPSYINDKFRGGVIPEALYSDIIRISLLAEYGGLWIDSTVLCTGNALAARMKELPMFIFKTEELDRTQEPTLICSNWLISCYKNNPFIYIVRELLYVYWKTEKYVKNYFIFHIFMHMVRDAMPDIWESIPVYNNISPHILAFEMLNQYNDDRFCEIKKMSDFHKLNRHITDGLPEDANIKNSYYEWIISGRISKAY